ncbi:MAG: 4Fe-4S dicluster domain-containing protein, partial [Oscillospiraceae bacterium]|nr:4Fe-4S dicluster domain-containing protein [Oscillospiraceae bacterium]
LPNVMMVLSGMSTSEQMEDNISFMENLVPLTEDEQKLCFKVADIINSQIAVPCTGCSYCTDGCPQHIAIPQYFSLYNEIMREDMEQKGWTVSFSNYDALTKTFGKASECIACGQCEEMCPQHLTIIDHLKNVSKRFEQ